MATAALTPGPKFRYGSYESVEVVETSGSLSKIVAGGNEFWVKTAKLKEIRVPGTKSKVKGMSIAQAWNPEFELFFAKALESWVYLEYCGSPKYRGAFDDEYYAITDIKLEENAWAVYGRQDAGGGTSYNITLRDGLKVFIPGIVTVTHQHDDYHSISSKEIFFELVRRGLRLGTNRGNQS